MTLQNLPHLWLPRPPYMYSSGISAPSPVLDALDERLGWVFDAPLPGDISEIGWYIKSMSAANFTVDVRVETVDAATGYPTGTLVNANANKSAVFYDADNTWVWSALDTDATVTMGQRLAIVHHLAGYTSGSFATNRNADDRNVLIPYGVEDYGASWVRSSTVYGPAIALKYSDGTIVPLERSWPYTAVGETVFNNTDTPDHYGNHFQLSIPARAVGAWVWGDMGASTKIRLFDGSGAIAYVDLDNDIHGTGDKVYNGMFIPEGGKSISDFELAKDTSYYLAVEPQDGTDFTVPYADVASNADLDAYPGGKQWYSANKKDAGWSTTNTRRYFLGLILDQFDDGAGGGGPARSPIGLTGGLA